MSARPQQGAADRLPLLDTHRIVKLTDAAQALFSLLYDMERAERRALKVRLSAVLTDLDLFGAGQHYINHEDYQPSSGVLG